MCLTRKKDTKMMKQEKKNTEVIVGILKAMGFNDASDSVNLSLFDLFGLSLNDMLFITHKFIRFNERLGVTSIVIFGCHLGSRVDWKIISYNPRTGIQREYSQRNTYNSFIENIVQQIKQTELLVVTRY